MKKYTYQAIFRADEEGVAVTFPDVFGGVTCGKDYDDALRMAKELLSLMLSSAPDQCGAPASKDEMTTLFPNERIVPIEVELP